MLFSGFWLFHCHIEFHAEIGMALIFKVGEHEEMPPVPRNFPTCNDWKSTDNQAEDTDTSRTGTSILIQSMTTERTKSTDDFTEKIDQLLKYFEQFFKLQMTSSASSSSVTLLLFIVCLLSSIKLVAVDR